MKTDMSTLSEHESDLLLPGEDLSASRRNFLRLAGFGVASSVLGACSRGPLQKVVPLLTGSQAIVPGLAYWIATTCAGCSAACGVLARCRDGRPVKLEGNPQHELSRGGLCAVGQADLLGLYDSRRAAEPVLDGRAASWDEALAALRARVQVAVDAGRAVRVLTGSVHSPSTRAALQGFLDGVPGARQVRYDALSSAAWLDATDRTHGVRALPSLHFDRARVIAAFDADFLGTWISPVEFAADYAAGRRPDGDAGQAAHMSRHLHFEARVSLTGLAADERAHLAPWQQREALRLLCAGLEQRAGVEARLPRAQGEAKLARSMHAAADELWAARGAALVVYGGNDVEAALLANYANHLLDAWGRTLTLARPSLQRMGDDRSLAVLQRELEQGDVGVLIVSGVNPAYEWPAGLSAALTRAGTLVVHSDGLDETWALAAIGLPSSHALESWNDGEPQLGRYTLTQPCVPPLRAGRTLRALLHGLGGDERPDHELLRDFWRRELFGQLGGGGDFESFFRRALHDGFVEGPAPTAAEPGFRLDAVHAPVALSAPANLGLVLYAKVGLHAGAHAHNPWLQELPDPVTKAVWDNYACLSPLRAAELDVADGDLVRVRNSSGFTLELPVLVQLGQHDDVVAVARGYGRLGTERFAHVGPDWLEARPTLGAGGRVGESAEPLIAYRDDYLRTDSEDVTVERVGGSAQLAVTQDYNLLEVPIHLAPPGGELRDCVRTTAFADLLAGVEHAHAAAQGEHEPELWTSDHEPQVRRWGMAIDLTSCTGCSACVISCQSENNVPVVGKDEVARHREMHWLRIDRYFTGEGGAVTAAHQPMLCQHCGHAPCESVCPVLATVHSSEGLNQQVYNRCVGTRYCANTCPYKVRRFNWFEYPHEDSMRNLALNPDVAIRTRGVMEKCSFCAQRIVEAKAQAKSEGRELADGDMRTACQQSCPTQAIEFGDVLDPESRVSVVMRRQRAYGVLTELNVQPSVRYLTRVVQTGSGEQRNG